MVTVPLIEWWFTALNEPVGIILITNERSRLVTKLYAARQECAEKEELMGLSLCMSPTNENELWIVHKKVMRVEDAQGTP